MDVASRNHEFSNRGSHFLSLGFLKYNVRCIAACANAGIVTDTGIAVCADFRILLLMLVNLVR